MSFSGNVRPPAVDTDDAMEATDVPEERRGITPDVRRTGCAPLGDCGIGEDIFRLYVLMCFRFAGGFLVWFGACQCQLVLRRFDWSACSVGRFV